MPTWDPDLYRRFEAERGLPARDLLARIGDRSPARVIDLGCGPGTSTALLRARWPAARLEGLDSSPEMLAQARASDPVVTWTLGDLAVWRASQPYDVVFSNAVLHWVPRHAELFPRLLDQVAPGGVLAVQMPVNSHSPAHRAVRAAASDGPWASTCGSLPDRAEVEPADAYYRWLAPCATSVELWETEYVHVLPGATAIVDWLRGTTLRPYLDALETTAWRDAFLERISALVARGYPPQPDGRVLFPFRRLFVVVRR